MLLFGKDRVRTSDDVPFPAGPPINDIVGWAFLLVDGDFDGNPARIGD